MFTVISLSHVHASAGRAFPIESENYVIEQFHRINPLLVKLSTFTSVFIRKTNSAW